MKIIQIVVVPLKGSICDDQERILGLGEDGDIYIWSWGEGRWYKYSLAN